MKILSCVYCKEYVCEISDDYIDPMLFCTKKCFVDNYVDFMLRYDSE